MASDEYDDDKPDYWYLDDPEALRENLTEAVKWLTHPELSRRLIAAGEVAFLAGRLAWLEGAELEKVASDARLAEIDRLTAQQRAILRQDGAQRPPMSEEKRREVEAWETAHFGKSKEASG